jgi:hypothetical protein
MANKRVEAAMQADGDEPYTLSGLQELLPLLEAGIKVRNPASIAAQRERSEIWNHVIFAKKKKP